MNPGIEKRLEGKGIKPTAIRILVLDHLINQSSALSLTELEKALTPVDRVTVAIPLQVKATYFVI